MNARAKPLPVVRFDWDPDKHPRDDGGKFTATGGTGDAKPSPAPAAGITVYHGTVDRYLDSIREDGLVAHGAPRNFENDISGGGVLYKGVRGESVFVSENLASAKVWAYRATDAAGGGDPLVLKFVIPTSEAARMRLDENSPYPFDYLVYGGVAAKYLDSYAVLGPSTSISDMRWTSLRKANEGDDLIVYAVVIMNGTEKSLPVVRLKYNHHHDEQGRFSSAAEDAANKPPPEPPKPPPPRTLGPKSAARIAAFEDEVRSLPREQFLSTNEEGKEFWKQGEPTRVPMSSEEINEVRRQSPAVFSHNHPNDSSISEGDVAFASNVGIHEVRAAVSTGAYVMRGIPDQTKIGDFIVAAHHIDSIQRHEWEAAIARGEMTRAWCEQHHYDAVWRRVTALPAFQDSMQYFFEPKK